MKNFVRSLFVLVLIPFLCSLPLLAMGHGQMVIQNRVGGAGGLRIVQSIYCDPGPACAYPANVTAGNIQLFWSFNNDFCCNIDTPNSTRCPFGSGAPTEWHEIQRYIAANFMGVVENYCNIATSGPETVTIAPRASGKWIAMEIAGQAAGTYIDASPAWTVAPSTGTTISNSLTTTVSGDLLIAVTAYEYGVTNISTNVGWTFEKGSGVVAASRPIDAFKQKAGAPGVYSVTFTNNNGPNSRNFVAAIIAIKPH